jgi:hypothetical protein
MGKGPKRWNAPQFLVPRHIFIGRVAQLVEQRIENPRVGSSILSPATIFLSSFLFSTWQSGLTGSNRLSKIISLITLEWLSDQAVVLTQFYLI